MKLILNADDLGISEPVNLAIFDLLDRGLITSATLMANAPGFAHAVEGARARPDQGFGVHLNITDFGPVSGSEGWRDYLREGRFPGNAAAKSTRFGPELLARVVREWVAQVEAVRDSGIEPTHLDGHHHMHAHLPLVTALAEVRRQTGVERVRSAENLFPPGASLARRANRWWRARAFRNRFGSSTTELFAKYITWAEMGESTPEAESVELMLHPGGTDPVFVRENALLETDAHRRLLERCRPVSYRDL